MSKLPLNKDVNELRRVYQASSNLQTEMLFLNLFNCYPSKFVNDSMDISRMISLLKQHYGNELNVLLHEEEYNVDKNSKTNSHISIPSDHLIICCSGFKEVEIFYSAQTDPLQLEKVKEFLSLAIEKNNGKGKIFLLSKPDDYSGEFGLAKFEVPDPKVDFDLHYNDDLKKVDSLLDQKLNDGKGIILLHGLPGTGKTTYIRHRIQKSERKVIYIPQDMSAMFGRPEFIQFLMKHTGALLVIEDAENLLLEREASLNGGVIANLLNMTDGLLSDCLKLQVICTFNIDVSKIDKAILRKGRITARYEFGKLSLEKTKRLIKHLGKSYYTSEGMTLAEIFNLEESDFQVRNESLIGFKN